MSTIYNSVAPVMLDQYEHNTHVSIDIVAYGISLGDGRFSLALQHTMNKRFPANDVRCHDNVPVQRPMRLRMRIATWPGLNGNERNSTAFANVKIRILFFRSP
jgi:hypothetical protein